MSKLIITLLTTITVLMSSLAHAYIGPGMSGGVIAATLGIIIAIFAGLFGILYYPIKRFVKNRKRKNATHEKK